MAIRYDIALKYDGDLPIGAKLMGTAPSDLQHQKDMFSSFAGEWKQFPSNGVGIARYLKSSGNDLLTIEKKGRQALKADGYTAGKMKFSYSNENKLIIDTNASR